MTATSPADVQTGWAGWLNSRPLFILFLVSLAGCYGAMSVAVLPALINAWVADLSISDSAAGLIASCNVLGATVSLALGTWLVSRMRLPAMMAVGLAVAASGDALSIFVRDAAVLLPVRFVCGFGLGLIVAATTNWIGRHAQADRGFGFYMTLQFVFTAVLFALIPLLEPVAGNAAVYFTLLILACCTLVLLPVLWRADGGEKLPDEAPRSAQAANGTSYALSAALIVASLVLFELAAIGVWTYMLRYGEMIGLSTANASRALSLCSLCGIPGGVLVVVLGARYGRLMPIIAALGLFIAVHIAFSIRVVTPAVFIIGTALLNIAWNFVFPYLQGVQSALDRTGRLAIWGMLCASLGGAVGPAFLGAMVEGQSYHSAFNAAAAILAGSLLAAIAPALVTDRLLSVRG